MQALTRIRLLQHRLAAGLDCEMVPLLAGFLHGRDKPLGLQAPTAPCLSFVGRIAILGLKLATSELAGPIHSMAIHR